MKTEEINKYNKLIAEFIGLKSAEIIHHCYNCRVCNICNEAEIDSDSFTGICTPCAENRVADGIFPEGLDNTEDYITDENGNHRILKYDSSWNWLMPVVQKIKEINIDKPIWMFEELNQRLLFVDIKGVYKCVVEYIKWYNKQENI